jgi:hypothetical protein
MQPFTTIPGKDIDYLLKTNNLSTNKDKYLTAWNFIITNSEINIPISIADYIIAYNHQKENIIVMTIFDIIKTNYKINGLSAERTTRVLRYLNKLDERDPFVELPDEVLPLILKEFSCEQILKLCGLSKRFNNICKKYKHNLFDRFLLEKGFTITEYNPEIICKALKFNKRIMYGGYYDISNITYDLHAHNAFDGSVIGIFNDIENFKDIEFPNIGGLKNIISIMFNPDDNYILFLDSFGNVFTTESMYDEEGTDKVFLALNNIKLVPNLKNIVQIITNTDYPLFLDLYGNVFKMDGGLIISNIVEMYSDYYSFIFRDTNNDLYGYGSNIKINDLKNATSLVKLDKFKNIKNVLMNGEHLITLDYNNTIKITGLTESSYNLKFIGNIIKMGERKNEIFLLNNQEILYRVGYSSSNPLDKILNVKDFDTNDYFLTLMLSSNKIDIYGNSSNYLSTVKGEIILIDNNYILINKELYRMKFNTKNIEFIKI